MNGEIKIDNNQSKDKNNLSVMWVISILISFIFGMMGAYIITSNLSVDKNTVKGMITNELIETSVASSADKVYNSIISNITPTGVVDASIASSVDKVYDRTVVVISLAKGKQVSTGTGFIYKIENNKAYIMTNNHVIDDGDSARIEFNSGNERFDAQIVGGDTYSDIAVLTMDAKNVVGAVDIGDSTNLNLGDTIFTVGAPMGIDYKGTVTKGIVSGLDRLVGVSLASNSTDYFMKVIQMDAAVNPGNSGGPLCDVSGKVVGVISLKIVQDEVEGMGFAIPIEDALKYANAIEKGGEIVRPYIGISMLDLTDEYTLWQNRIFLPEGVDEGVAVLEVVDGSPADKAGFKKGDIIVKLGDADISGLADFRYQLYKHDVGDKLEVTYYRDGKKKTTTITLGKNEK